MLKRCGVRGKYPYLFKGKMKDSDNDLKKYFKHLMFIAVNYCGNHIEVVMCDANSQFIYLKHVNASTSEFFITNLV